MDFTASLDSSFLYVVNRENDDEEAIIVVRKSL